MDYGVACPLVCLARKHRMYGATTFCLASAKICPSWVKIGPIEPSSGNVEPESLKITRESAKFDQIWPGIDLLYCSPFHAPVRVHVRKV